jgi:hypothetical protein
MIAVCLASFCEPRIFRSLLLEPRAGTGAKSGSLFRQDRGGRVSHGRHWAPNVVQLPCAGETSRSGKSVSIAKKSKGYASHPEFCTFRSHPPTLPQPPIRWWGMPPTRLHLSSGRQLRPAMRPKFLTYKTRIWAMMRQNSRISSPTENSIRISSRAAERGTRKYLHILNS